MSASTPFAPKKNTTQSTNANGQTKAEAFGNCVMIAKDKSEHKLPKGIPLDSNNRVSRSLINAAKAAAENNEEFTIQLTCTVKLVTDDSGLEDIVLV